MRNPVVLRALDRLNNRLVGFIKTRALARGRSPLATHCRAISIGSTESSSASSFRFRCTNLLFPRSTSCVQFRRVFPRIICMDAAGISRAIDPKVPARRTRGGLWSVSVSRSKYPRAASLSVSCLALFLRSDVSSAAFLPPLCVEEA